MDDKIENNDVVVVDNNVTDNVTVKNNDEYDGDEYDSDKKKYYKKIIGYEDNKIYSYDELKIIHDEIQLITFSYKYKHDIRYTNLVYEEINKQLIKICNHVIECEDIDIYEYRYCIKCRYNVYNLKK